MHISVEDSVGPKLGSFKVRSGPRHWWMRMESFRGSDLTGGLGSVQSSPGSVYDVTQDNPREP